MPPLAKAKARVAEELRSSATKSESRQTMLCAYLSAGLLLGLSLNALLGWWWADPATALVIAAVALREGRDAWRGESCCTAPIAVPGSDGCAEDCCSSPVSVTEPRDRPAFSYGRRAVPRMCGSGGRKAAGLNGKRSHVSIRNPACSISLVVSRAR